MHDTTGLDSIAAALVIITGSISLVLFLGMSLAMSFGAITSKSNTVALLVAFGLVAVTVLAAVISITSGNTDIAAAIAIAVAVVAVLFIVGLVLVMGIGAIFSGRQLVTSWPQAQEAMFAPHEAAISKSAGIAWAGGLGAMLVVFGIIAGINLGVEPPKKDYTKDMNMSNISKKKAADPTPAPAPDAEKK